MPWWKVRTAIAPAINPRNRTHGRCRHMVVPRGSSLVATVVRRQAVNHRGRAGLAVVLQCNAAQPQAPHGADQPPQLSAAAAGGRPSRPDIGDAVALGIRAYPPRLPGEIHAEAVGRRQSRAFADQHRHRFGAHRLADIVAKGDASLLRHHDRRDGPVALGTAGATAARRGAAPRWRTGRRKSQTTVRRGVPESLRDRAIVARGQVAADSFADPPPRCAPPCSANRQHTGRLLARQRPAAACTASRAAACAA